MKQLYIQNAKLNSLGIVITLHDKLPDLIFLWSDDNEDILVIIEVVTSHGPVSEKRRIELEDTLKKCIHRLCENKSHLSSTSKKQ